MLCFMLVAGCTGASPTESASGGDGAAADGARTADLSTVEAERVFTGGGGSGRRNGARVTVADELRVFDLGQVCISDREAAGPLCALLDEPSAAAVTVEVGLANTSDAPLRLGPGDATLFAGPLPAESADRYAQSSEPVVVEPGSEVTGAVVWVLSGSVDDVTAAMDAGDYGLEFVVRGPDDQPVLTQTTLGVLASEAAS